MSAFEALDADPAFRKLSYGAQVEVRKRIFDRDVASDPRFQALAPDVQAEVYRRRVEAPPAYEDDSALAMDYTQRAQATVDRMSQGDRAAVDDAVTGIALRNTLKSSFVATVAAKGVDALGDLFDSSRPHDEISKGYFGADGQKTTDWLSASVARYGGEGAASSAAMWSTAGALGLGFLETALTGTALIGSATKAGALTKGLFGPGGRLAEMISGIGKTPLHNLARSQLPGIAESAAYGLLGTVEGTVRNVLQGEAGDPTKVEWYGKAVRDLGIEFATNYVGWNVLRGLSTVVRAQVKAQKGFKAEMPDVSEAAVYDAVKTSLNNAPALKVAGKSTQASLLADEARMRVVTFDPKGDDGFNFAAKAAGFEPTFVGKDRVTLASMVDPDVKMVGLTRREAERKIAEALAAGQASGVPSAEAAVKSIASTASEANVLRERLVGTLSKSAKPETLVPLITPHNGIQDEASVRAFAKAAMRARGMSDEAIEHTTVRLVDGAAESTHVSDIVLPKTIASYADEVAFNKRLLDGVERAAQASGVAPSPVADKRAAALLESIGARKTQAGNVTPESLDFVAKRFLGASVRDAARGGFDLRGADDQVLDHFDTLADVQRGIYGNLVNRGVVSVNHLNSVVQTRSGFRLEAYDKLLTAEGSRAQGMSKVPQATVKAYRLTKPQRRADGSLTSTQVDESESLSELLARHPDLDPRLPSSFAPRTYVIEDGSTKVAVESNLVSGQLSELLAFTNAFDDTPMTTIVSSNAKKRIVQKAVGQYELVNDMLGTRQTFTGRTDAAAMAMARKAMSESADAWTEASDALAMKGFKADVTPDGTIVAIGPSGVEASFKSLDELRAWHSRTPMPTWISDIQGADFVSAASRDVEIATVQEAMRPRAVRGPVRGMQSLWTSIETLVGPSGMTLDEMAKRAGTPGLSRAYQQMRNSVRLVDGTQSQLEALIGGVFKGTTKKLQYKMYAASQWPEAVRASRWKQVFGEAMPPEATAGVGRIRAYLDGMRKVSGIDDFKTVTDYLPRIRQFLNSNQDFIVDDNTAAYLAKAAFPMGVPKEFELFASKLRTTDVAKMALIDDPEELLQAYTHAVLRVKYLNPVIESTSKEIDALVASGKYRKEDLAYLADTFSLLKGAPRSRSDTIASNMAQAAADTVTRTLKKIAPKLVDPRATPGEVMNKLNYRMTLSTQATKPFAPLRDWFQINNLSWVYDSSTPWKASKALLDDDALLEATVKKMTKSGAATFQLPEEAMTAKKGFWQKQMRTMENMNVLTRAVAWRSAETWYDDAIARFRKGVTDLEGFARETRLQLLNAPEQEIVLAAAKAGADDVAKDAYANAITTLTMYDFAGVSKPLVARGFLGKLFGKFMTYPASTVALYGRILSSGSKADRLAMLGRLVASTTMTYEAFKAAGVDYQGFMWSDPFSFQGGPLWSLLVDGTGILGTDAQAKATRTRILTSLPRLMSPTLAFASQVRRAFAYLDEGDERGALATLAGAPASRMLVKVSGSNLLWPEYQARERK